MTFEQTFEQWKDSLPSNPALWHEVPIPEEFKHHYRAGALQHPEALSWAGDHWAVRHAIPFPKGYEYGVLLS